MLPFADLASLVFILALVTPFVRRNIQLAGYDVYYEPKTLLSREYFVENLRKCVDMAAKKLVMLSIETMDDPFINSLDKVTYYKSQVRSPWLQACPDVGNLTAWPTNDVGRKIESNIDNIVAVHLKDTKPVGETSKGVFKRVPFGEGAVDFEACLRIFKRLGYQGSYTVEMWTDESPDPVAEVTRAKKMFDGLFDVVETLKKYPKSQAVLMQNHGPFTIGKDAEAAVKAAAMTEEVAHTMWAARQLGDIIEIPQADIDKLNDRYQNVYGQH